MTVAAGDLGLATQESSELRLPPGRRVELEGRGTTFVREVAGPPGAPTLVLLHGWVASGGLNWFRTFDALGQHFRVLAPDLRGHGRGIRSWRRFRLSDCADDVAELCRVLDAGPVIAVGYSMGGAVAQLLWRRHRELVAGLVLCATSHHILPGVRERLLFTTWMSAIAGTTRLGELTAYLPRSVARALVPLPRTRSARPRTLARWAAAEMARHDWRLLLEAGVAIGRFDARRWIGDVDVPTAVVVTTQDRALGARPQLELAIPGAVIHRIEDGHVACAREEFAAPLVGACLDVARRATPTTALEASAS